MSDQQRVPYGLARTRCKVSPSPTHETLNGYRILWPAVLMGVGVNETPTMQDRCSFHAVLLYHL